MSDAAPETRPPAPPEGDQSASAPVSGRVYGYPIMLDVTGRLALIVGGGAVAARKAAGLIEAGATRVRCVAPQFPATFPAEVEKVAERYERRHLEGAGLVFAATDSAEVNDAVVRDARARGVLVSRADAGQGRAGDFATPAVLRRSAVTVTVSAGSPALSARVRDGLAARWDERWSRMAEAMQQLRPTLIRAGASDSLRRAELFRDLASEQALDVVAAGGLEGLCRWLAARRPDWKGAGGVPDPESEPPPGIRGGARS